MRQSERSYNVWIAGMLFLVLMLCVPSVSGAANPKQKAAGGPLKKTAVNDVQKNAAQPLVDYKSFPDMSDFDPNHPVTPHGDTVRVAVVAPFSGPAVINGQIGFLAIQWAAHAVNKKGGIMIDGRKKLIEIIKADNQSNPDATKKICERMVLQEKVHVLMGTNGSNLMKIINATAKKYNIVAVNYAAHSDDLMDATNFSRNAFMTTMSVSQIGRGLAYYYGQIRKKEKKFYVLCQDYSFGRGMAKSFIDGLKEYYPEAQLVGEDYHRLFLTDYAPFLTKIRASGAEVIYTGDWMPDSGNLLKQTRQMGIKLPFAHLFLDEPNMLSEVGVEGTEGLVQISQYGADNPIFKTPEQKKYFMMWHKLWENKWKAPYNTILYEWGAGNLSHQMEQALWLFSVLNRAQSTDPEKVIKVWEGDTYRFMMGKVVKMRACDHKIIEDFHVYEYVRPEKQKINMNIPPYYWFKNASAGGPVSHIPAEKVLPWMDQNLDRCKGKNAWGE